ncbi:hypothetical protein [Streptomyces formicae]
MTTNTLCLKKAPANGHVLNVGWPTVEQDSQRLPRPGASGTP